MYMCVVLCQPPSKMDDDLQVFNFCASSVEVANKKWDTFVMDSWPWNMYRTLRENGSWRLAAFAQLWHTAQLLHSYDTLHGYCSAMTHYTAIAHLWHTVTHYTAIAHLWHTYARNVPDQSPAKHTPTLPILLPEQCNYCNLYKVLRELLTEATSATDYVSLFIVVEIDSLCWFNFNTLSRELFARNL